MKLINYFFPLFFLFLFTVKISAQDNSNKILFLQFHFINNTPELTDMQLVNGKLKVRRNQVPEKPGYSFAVFSNQNKILFKNNIDDPSKSTYEYPGDNGEIKRTEVKEDTKYFSVRVPYSKNINKIVFYKTSPRSTLSNSANISRKVVYECLINHNMIKQGN